MLHRVSGSYGVSDSNTSVLVPMPASAQTRASDFTGDAHQKNKRLVAKDRQIRVKGQPSYLWRSNMHGIATEVPAKRANAGKHEAARLSLARAYVASPDTFDFSRFDKRTARRIRALAETL